MTTKTAWANRITGHGVEAPDKLLANPRNWRIHPKAQKDALGDVLDRVGWVQEVIVNQRTGHVLDGHLRVSLAISRAEPEVPVKYVDLSLEDELLVLATYDPLGAMAVTDQDILAELRGDVTTEGALADMLDALSGNKPKAGKTDPDAVPPTPDEPTTKPGDLWLLGEHRLLCGDATNEEHLQRLMDFEWATAVLTDPPYGQDQKGVPHDSPEEHKALCRDVVNLLPIKDAGIVVAFQSPRLFVDWLLATEEAGHQFERMLWLYKAAQMTFPWRGWIMKSEAILVSTIGSPQWEEVHPYSHDCYYLADLSSKTSGYEIPDNSGWHGSIKPLSVVEDLAARVSAKGDVVYDPFLGSGTTLIACERLGRRCYAIEIEPRYVDVAVRRWEMYTGQKAVLDA